MRENSRQLLEQTAINLEDYLRSMRRISDAMYYSVIKDKDLEQEGMDEETTLLYEANKDNLVSIACYTYDGGLVEATPVANEKRDVTVALQDWFVDAKNQLENFHFSTPHVQNLFDDLTYRYYWVVSLSRTVDLTYGGRSTLGVLLVDMNYSSIERILDKANTASVSSEYVYLMDPNGEIIYHPKQELIRMGRFQENNQEAVHASDESWKEADCYTENNQLHRMEACQCRSAGIIWDGEGQYEISGHHACVTCAFGNGHSQSVCLGADIQAAATVK